MRHVGTMAFDTPRLICRRFERGDRGDMFRNWAADPRVQMEYGEPVYDSPEQVDLLLSECIAGYQRPDL